MNICCEYGGKSVASMLGGYLKINGNDSPSNRIAGNVAGALYRFFVDGVQPEEVGLKNIRVVFNISQRSYIGDKWVDDKTGEPTDGEVVDSMLGMAERDIAKMVKKYNVSLIEPEIATEAVTV